MAYSVDLNILNLFLSKQLTINKCTYSPRLNKYRDSYVLYNIPTVHAFGSVNFTHTIFVQTHVSMTFPPGFLPLAINLPLESCDVSCLKKFRNNRFSCFVHRYNLKSNSLVFTSSLAFEINTLIKWLIVFR